MAAIASKKVQYITAEKAAELLNKSVHSVRQLLQRGKIVKHKRGHNIFADLNSVLTYHARKKNLPSWEENIEKTKEQVFVSTHFTASSLLVQESYVLILIREKKLDGYITSAGDVMIHRDSINEYLRTLDHDKPAKAATKGKKDQSL